MHGWIAFVEAIVGYQIWDFGFGFGWDAVRC